MAPRLVLGALCVVCIVGSVLAVEAKSFPTLASQLRGAKGSVATASSHHDEYEESKYYSSNSICLKEIKRTGCAYETGFDPARKAGGIIGGPTPDTTPADMQTSMFTSDVACCNDKDEDDSYGKKGMFIEQKGMYSPAVGNCDFVNFIREENAIEILARVTYKVGNAQITCSFFDGAEKCDSDLCDGASFTVQATIYQIAAYSHTPGFSGTGTGSPLQAPNGIDCPVIVDFYDPDFVIPTDGGRKAQKSAGKKVETASYDDSYRNPYYEEYSHIPETLYYGNAVIYVGSITSVQSPKHEKYIGGKFEMVADWNGKAPLATDVTDYRATWINGPGVAVELDKLGKY